MAPFPAPDSSELTSSAIATRPTLTALGHRPSPQPTRGKADRPSLRIARGPQTGLVFDLPQGTTTLGRADAADITLDDTTVSRRHAELRRAGERVVLCDLGSLNGTYLNRQPLAGDAELADGDEIWTGKFRFQFRGR